MSPLQGHLLISGPDLLDPNFFHTVVLMVQHGNKGGFGLVLNRPSKTTLEDAWQQVAPHLPCERDDALYVGGPCEGFLMALHADAEAGEIAVFPGLYFSSSADNLQHIVSSLEIPARFFVGYAGWEAGQLEEEMKTGAWLLCPATPINTLYHPDTHWDHLFQHVNLLQRHPWLNPRLVPLDPATN